MWTTLAPFILQALIQYGPVVAQQIHQSFTQSSGPTAADWENLIKLTSQTKQTQMMDALIRNGVDPNSQAGKDLLALVAGPATPNPS